MGLPSWAAGVADVTIEAVTARTVTLEAPLPEPGVLVTMLTAAANPSWEVWIPGLGCESLVGRFKTSKVKRILQVSPGWPGGWRITGADGVNETLPVAGSITVMVKVMPAHAVPASPTPVGESWKTPGSANAGGQSPEPLPNDVPQAGTSDMAGRPGNTALMVSGSTLSGGVEALRIWRLAGRPVSPTDTGEGKVGVTPRPTPALAGSIKPTKGAATIANSTATIHQRGLAAMRRWMPDVGVKCFAPQPYRDHTLRACLAHTHLSILWALGARRPDHRNGVMVPEICPSTTPDGGTVNTLGARPALPTWARPSVGTTRATSAD